MENTVIDQPKKKESILSGKNAGKLALWCLIIGSLLSSSSTSSKPSTIGLVFFAVIIKIVGDVLIVVGGVSGIRWLVLKWKK